MGKDEEKSINAYRDLQKPHICYTILNGVKTVIFVIGYTI